MNCTNCSRPMNTAGLCIYCDECPCGEHGTTNGLRDVAPDRQTLALESIAESLRQLPTKRELLAAIERIAQSGWTGANTPSVDDALKTADAIIAACKERKGADGR